MVLGKTRREVRLWESGIKEELQARGCQRKSQKNSNGVKGSGKKT